MIFDTQGTGFYKEAVRQMMAQEEIPYLSGLSGPGGGLGDEIMLLEGLDDLGSMYPHGYDDGPARTYTMPTSSDGTLYDFSTGPVETGMSGANLGASVNSNQGAWPRQANQSWNYTGLGAGWPRQESRYLPRKYQYTGVSGLRGASIKRGRYAYTGLMSLGDAQSDARTAMMIAETTKTLGLAAAGAITDPGQRSATIAGINAAYAAARVAIVASYGTDGTYPAPAGTPPPDQATQEQIDAKLRLQAERSGIDPAEVGIRNDSGISTNTMIIGGAVIVALLAGVYIMKG